MYYIMENRIKNKTHTWKQLIYFHDLLTNEILETVQTS